jgi:hypothetical protein
VNGGVILATTAGSPRKLARMATATGLIAVDLPLNATVTRARLLVFTTGEPSPAGAAPGMGDPVVSLGEGPLTPSASYRDCLPGATGCPALQTLSFDLRGWQPPAGGVRVTVKHPGGQAVPFAWDGAAIVAAYEREGDPRTDYWISEGADGVLRDPDAALPDSEARTLADFPGEVNRSLAREAFFIPVSTVPEGGQGDGHLVIFNGNEWVSPLSGEGVWSARLDVRPYLRSAGNRAVVESAGISGRGDLLANRMWILVVTSGNDTPLEEAGETGSPVVPVLNAPLSIVPPTGTGTMETLEPPGNPATTVYKGNPGGEEQASTPVPGAEGIAGNVTLLDQILRIITSFFQWNGGTGENTGPVFTPSPTPAVPPGPATELVGSPFILPEANQSIGEEVLPCYNLTVTSSPDRALVSLDGAYLSKVTPVNLTCVARGVHELKLEKDDFREAVIPLDLTEHTTVHEDLTSVYTAYGSTLRTYTELTGGTADRCGGVFVASSMGKARVLLDGKDTGLFTDTVLSGLKPGLHTIRIRPEKNEFPDSTRQVWVYPSIISMVRFESSPPLKREVTVESPELRKAEFTVNGRYPSFRIPRKVTLDSWESYITVRENGTYTSFPTHAVDYNGTLIVRRPDPPLLTTVEVRSDPRGADILIDGFPTGLNTPATVRNLSPGNHRVLVSAPGFLPQERAILQEDLKGDGPDTVLGFFLESYAYGSLEVTSTPPGARIFLFQRDTGEKTPHVFPSLVIGTYDVKLENGEDSRTIYGVTVTPFGFTSRHGNLSVG